MLELRSGLLDPAETAEIHALLDASGLENLEPFYDYQASGELAVEHTYYWLRYAAQGQQPVLVGFHIQVLPDQLRPLLVRLEMLPKRLDVQTVSGAYLLAGEAQLLNTKRYIESRITLATGRLQEYPILARSLAEPYRLLSLSAKDQTAVESVLNPAASTLEVEQEGMLQTIILLQAASP